MTDEQGLTPDQLDALCGPKTTKHASTPLDMPFVMIATPCKDGRVDINYTMSLCASCQVLSAAGIKYVTVCACSSSVDNARNALATTFMKSECTHLLFIDDDMCWASDLPLRLLNENVDIVGAPCRKKQFRVEFNVRHTDHVGYIGGRPWMLQIDGIGMGVTLIHRKVFEALSGSVPKYYMFNEDKEPTYMFFRHQLIEDGGRTKYESEDFNFCRLAREKGMEIFGYADELVPHIGRVAFSARYSDRLHRHALHGFTSKRERYEPNVVGTEEHEVRA